MLRLFEAFAGYGTASFALKELGVEHELVGFSEIDKYAIKCFVQNHCKIFDCGTLACGNMEAQGIDYEPQNYGDITKINWNEVPDFDLLTGGFPCQSFSVAGKGLGHLDERGVLANYLTKALIEKQPKYFLFENVKGFMSKKHAEFRETLFNDWRNAGYAITYKVLNTKDFGVPQNRERVFIVGIRKDIKRFGDFVFPEPFELKLKLKDILESEVDEKYFLRKEQVDKIVNSSFVSRKDLLQKKDECSALRARDYKEPKCIKLKELTKDVSQAMRIFDSDGVGCTLRGLGGGMGAKTGLYALGCAVRAWPRTGSNDLNREQRLEFSGREEANSISSVQKDSMVSIIDLYNKKEHFDRSPSLTEPHHNNLRVMVYDDYNSKIKEDSNTSCTLTQNSGAKAERNGQKLIINSKVRRLTPRECFRLQGFLDDRVNLDGLSDTQKYKLAGNGQSVNVVKLLFKELVK